MTTPSADPTPPLILINPRASKIHDPARREQVSAAVIGAVRKRFGREPRVESETLEATRAALAEATEAPLVVVVGGDGTVREAAAALLGRGTPLAIVPAGTGNVLAAAVGIRGMRSGIDAIRHGHERVIDLGRARWTSATGDTTPNERLFAVACGMGLDARIMAAAEHEWKRRMGFGAYIGAAVREVLRLETARFHIEADGETLDIEGYLVLIANAGELVPAGSARAARSTPATACSTSSCSVADPSEVFAAQSSCSSARATSKATSSAGRSARSSSTPNPRSPSRPTGTPTRPAGSKRTSCRPPSGSSSRSADGTAEFGDPATASLCVCRRSATIRARYPLGVIVVAAISLMRAVTIVADLADVGQDGVLGFIQRAGPLPDFEPGTDVEPRRPGRCSSGC